MPDDIIEVKGKVLENLPNTQFRVEIDSQAPEGLAGQTILCHLAGKLRMNYIRILPGDKVKLDISRYDLTKGRITYRER